MLRRSFLAALLLCAAACGPSATEPARVRAAGASHDETPPPPRDTTTISNDTTHRGGGTIGSGT
ncbi:MAG TPA: hypothetical protein VF006_29530 [Longimicrobium sp.]